MLRSRRAAVVAGVVAVVLVVAGAVVLVGRDDEPDGRRAAPTTTSSDTALPAEIPASEVGSRGLGDPYYPDLGNGGYDVEHYDLTLAWDPQAATLEGRAVVRATATQPLRRFHLDLAGLEVRSVEVDGAPASVARDANELVITPAERVEPGASFTTTVAYGGTPEPITLGTDLFELGWTTDGREAYVVSEPAGAATFYPVNDHPSDKATYSFHVTAPSDQVVATNGLAVERTEHADGTTTWDSSARDPMASYLVQVAIGDYELVDGGTSSDGVPIRHVLHRRDLERAKVAVARTAEMLDVMADVWGPYPFEAYGVLAVDEDLGFALETQTLSIIGRDIARDGRGADTILLHELAHQWVGDTVSPATWKDIWLNEGFATYSEWLWSERTGGAPAAELARRQLQGGLDVPPGDPGGEELFQGSVYLRGGVTLQVLRERIGDDAFFRLLRTWVAEQGGGSASTADLVALAERVSGQELDALFDEWLYQRGEPDL